MKKALARIVSVAAVFAVAGTGVVSSASARPRDDAAAVRHLQDELRTAADAGDVAGADAALSELDALLAGMSEGRRDLAGPALDETAAAQDRLAEQFPDGARTLVVPTLPAALNLLLQQLLATLSELVDNLLGDGVPVPV
ncbi:hypothetical protein [Actinophytocola sp. KF-1]